MDRSYILAGWEVSNSIPTPAVTTTKREAQLVRYDNMETSAVGSFASTLYFVEYSFVGMLQDTLGLLSGLL